jgi:signal transduction histidine kinase
MTHPRDPLPAIAPTLPAPPRFVERRERLRRAADRQLHTERGMLARALDVLVAVPGAEARLAAILELLATTARARRAAVLATEPERRVAVAVRPLEPLGDAQALAAWLDSTAPRSRARRAAAGTAPVSFVELAPSELTPPRRRRGADEDVDRGREAPPATRPFYAWLPIPGGDLAVGFDFSSGELAASVAERLPPELVRHFAAVLSIVSEQLRDERELATIRARDDERTRFVSTVAHELRTPLTGLTGYLDLILDGRVEDPEVSREFLDRCRVIASTMADLVGDLLELSRLEAGTLQLVLAPFPLADAVAQVLDAVAPLALDRDIELTSDLPPRLRAAVGDRRRVDQILTNLVGNAIKFTRPGSTIEVVAEFDGPVAIVAVRDEGPGIDAGDRLRIFERFHRLAAHERVAGTGLGLAIARDLARAMGGDLDVASVPASGSSFLLALPGPTAADDEMIESTLAARVALEEVRLEEHALIRRLGAAVGATDLQRARGATRPDGRSSELASRAGRPRLRLLSPTTADRQPAR